MPRYYKRTPKRRSEAQKASQEVAQDARWHHKNQEDKENRSQNDKLLELRAIADGYQTKVEMERKRFWNERRRNIRLQKANGARKEDLRRLKKEAYQLRGGLDQATKHLQDVQNTAEVCSNGLI